MFHRPAKLALVKSATGAVKERLDTCRDADDVFFDGKRDRIYVSCGEGTVDVLQRGPQGFGPAGRVPTSSGAPTSLFVPELDRLFVAVRAATRIRSSNPRLPPFAMMARHAGSHQYTDTLYFANDI